MTEGTFVAAGAGASRKIAAALEFGDFGFAFNDPPAGVGACGDVVLGFVALHAVGYPRGSTRRSVRGQGELGFKVEPIRPKSQGVRELPVDGLADGDERGVSVVVDSVAVHLDFDELAQASGQLGDQRLAKSYDPLDAQTEDLGGLGHGGQQFGCEMTDACGLRLVSGE